VILRNVKQSIMRNTAADSRYLIVLDLKLLELILSDKLLFMNNRTKQSSR